MTEADILRIATCEELVILLSTALGSEWKLYAADNRKSLNVKKLSKHVHISFRYGGIEISDFTRYGGTKGIFFELANPRCFELAVAEVCRICETTTGDSFSGSV